MILLIKVLMVLNIKQKENLIDDKEYELKRDKLNLEEDKLDLKEKTNSR